MSTALLLPVPLTPAQLTAEGNNLANSILALQNAQKTQSQDAANYAAQIATQQAVVQTLAAATQPIADPAGLANAQLALDALCTQSKTSAGNDAANIVMLQTQIDLHMNNILNGYANNAIPITMTVNAVTGVITTTRTDTGATVSIYTPPMQAVQGMQAMKGA